MFIKYAQSGDLAYIIRGGFRGRAHPLFFFAERRRSAPPLVFFVFFLPSGAEISQSLGACRLSERRRRLMPSSQEVRFSYYRPTDVWRGAFWPPQYFSAPPQLKTLDPPLIIVCLSCSVWTILLWISWPLWVENLCAVNGDIFLVVGCPDKIALDQCWKIVGR